MHIFKERGRKALVRRNRLEISVKGLMLAVVVIIACVLAAIALYMVQRGKSTMNSGNNQFSTMMSDFAELDKAIYNGLEVSGEDVINLIDSLCNNQVVSVHVYTLLNPKKSGGGGRVYFAEKYSAPPKSDVNYINPTATFKGKVQKNANGVVTGIDFTQVG